MFQLTHRTPCTHTAETPERVQRDPEWQEAHALWHNPNRMAWRSNRIVAERRMRRAADRVIGSYDILAEAEALLARL